MAFPLLKRLVRRATLLTLALLWTVLAMAQNVKVSGTVRDPNGVPLSGASVIVDGSKRGTTTDLNGNFQLDVAPGDYTLIISYVGVQTQRQTITVPAGGMANLQYTTVSAGDLGGVVVVGSRSSTVRSSTQTVAPVDIISARELIGTGAVEPTQMINLIAPSFNSSKQTIADGTDHIDPATLRGLGPDQVLVLVNGKRRYNTAIINLNGTIGKGAVGTDLNSIPASSIERIEILRDGASSQYGSDAIAGVINVVLKKNQKGTTVFTHLGQQYKGDGDVRSVGITQGFNLGKEGFLTLSGEFRHRGFTSRTGGYTGTVYTNNVAQDEILIAQRGFSRQNNMRIGQSEVSNGGLTANWGVPLSSRLRFVGMASASWREGLAAGFYRYPRQTAVVNSQIYPDGYLPFIGSKILDRSAIIGLEGEIGNGFQWDLSQTLGGNSFRYDIKNTNNASQTPSLGANAPTEFYAGKIKFDQYTTNLNLSKDFGKGIGLKSFNVAVGGEYRTDNYIIEAGEEASYRNYSGGSLAGGSQVFPGFQPSNAVDVDRSVYAGYADIETDLSDRFLVNLAGRYENYSDFGSNFAGKLAARFKLTEQLSIRGSISNGFRAPSIHQRNFSSVQTVFLPVTGGLEPRQNGTFSNNSDVAKAFGMPSLEAEKTLNTSLGLTGRFGKGWNVTVDAYRIDIDDRIVLTGAFAKTLPPLAPNVVNELLADFPDVNSAAFFTNGIDTRTQGLDVIVSKDHKVGMGNLRATLAVNFNETEVTKRNPLPARLAADPRFGDNLLNPNEEGRIERAQPRDKSTLGINYTIQNWILNTRATRYGKVSTIFFNSATGALDPARDEYFSPKVVTDLSVGYKIKNFLTLTIGANNLTDVYPDRLRNPLNSNSGVFVYSREATQFGFNGGYYYASAVIDLHNLKINKKAKPAPTAPVVVMAPIVDTDGDGTTDAVDDCPTVAGPAALKGCPDTDGDGVADREDNCPSVAGAKIFNGCPDSDGDGVQDKDDKCPNQAGVARYGGCPAPDTDGDGIDDDNDRCPTISGTAENGGCPKEVAKEVQERINKEAKFILFETNSAKLKASSKGALDAIADAIKTDAGLFAEIEGHTDAQGSNEHNQKLSDARAASVREALIARGIDESKIASTGFGEEQPIASNDTAAGRQQNRRVVVKLRY